jgi:hypothetical protein
MKNPLITIGESIHASIPKTGKIMKQLREIGADAYSRPSEPLNYIKALIERLITWRSTSMPLVKMSRSFVLI